MEDSVTNIPPESNYKLYRRLPLNFRALDLPNLLGFKTNSNNEILRLRGGGKKRKKKIYTKPKKIKKQKTKFCLKVLEYYDFEKESIFRTRRESPSAPGCMMGEHSNRITCGKTGLSFLRKN